MEGFNTDTGGTDTLQAELGISGCDVITPAMESPLPYLDSCLQDAMVAKQRDDGDVTDGVFPSLPLALDSVDTHFVPHVTPSSPEGGEFSDFYSTEFVTPEFGDVMPISVHKACLEGVCDCRHFVGEFPSQLKPCRAAQFLFGPNALSTIPLSERDYLWHGLVNGFKIVDEDCETSYSCKNYDSIINGEFKEEMSTLLQSELQSHKVSRASSAPQCIHSLGAVRKSNGRLRPITDCSRPDGLAINNFMTSTFKSFSYKSVDTAVQMLEKDDFMAVIDIASAYRSVNVSADHTKFQGFCWDFGQGEETFNDNRLCFGLRCAPNIFNSLSELIVHIANAWGAPRIVNYLDDFLVMGCSQEECLAARDIVTSVITLLGFEVSWKKVTPPCQTTTFLGITIDSLLMELSLPMAKVEKLKLSIESIMAKDSATKKELECIGGLVSHCSYVVRGGRTFSRRIFDLSASYSRNSKAIPLNDAIKADLIWWLRFCECFNGKACIIKDLHPVPMYSDSSFLGFGAWMGRDWLAGCWSPTDVPSSFSFGCSHLCEPPTFDQAPRNINVLELWPVILGIRRWGPMFRNSFLHVITDNMQVLAMLCTGRSVNKLCMSWLRELFWMCFIWNIDISPSYIRSADNHLADALSRLPYSSVPDQCTMLLDGLNMCCSSPDRFVPTSAKEAPKEAAGRSPRQVYEDGSALPAEML